MLTRYHLQLFISYWGEHGSKAVEDLLLHVHRGSKAIEAEFCSKYGSALDRLSPPGPNTGAAREMGCLKKLNTALFTGPVFEKHLKMAEDFVKLLLETSEKYFIENVCGYREAEWQGRVDRTAARVHLTQLADHSSAVSEAFQNIVENATDHHVDYYLDHGATPDERKEKIFDFAREQRLPYNISITPRRSVPRLSPFGLQCSEVDQAPPPSFSWHHSLQHALSTLREDQGNANSISAYIRAAADTPGFVIKKSHLPDQECENLRTFMITKKVDFGRQLHGEFTKSERTKVAYELAECALLFLRTRWFSRICSCCIYRGESTSLKTAYTFRINRLHHSDHIDPETGIPCDFTQWCEEELLDMHIRRLGVLLTEIAVGSPVYDVAFNWTKNDIEIDFEAIFAEDENTKTAHFKDVLRR